jgi:hypothetical protein
MKEKSAQRRNDSARSFEAQREDAHEVVSRSREFGGRHLSFANADQLPERSPVMAGTVAAVWTAVPDRKRTRPAAHVEAGADTVGVALLLAQIHLQSRVEQAAQDCGHDLNGVEVRGAARQAHVADPELPSARSLAGDRTERW